jgi:Fe-S cluster assembly ATP-binding protein
MLEIRNLSYIPDGKNVLRSVNFSFEEKQIYVITGQNGSGKSSLVKIIAGFCPQSRGSVLYKGDPVDDWNITERAESFVACSFQNPVLFKGVSVAELLDVALKNGRSHMNKAELLHHVGLSPLEYMDRQIDETLSGGELKRIEIASVLARGMSLVILDEPEAGIDLWSFNRLTETIRKLNRDQSTTFILISHQEKLMSIADQIVCMKDGAIESVQSGSGFLKQLEKENAHVR